jgi:predicted transcriptional regulator
MKKTLKDWQVIIEQQQTSGLSIVEYCQQHQLSHKTFSCRKSDLKKKGLLNTASAFVEVKAQRTFRSENSELLIQLGQLKLSASNTVDPIWLGKLLRELT